MKLLVDFFPIILFFVAYKIQGIYWATAVAILASAAQVGWQWWRHRRVENMHLATLALLAVFGGLTIALQDPIFIMWKPTMVNWLFALVFLGSQWVGDRTIIERMMAHAIEVPKAVWARLNLAWSVFFFASGLANLYVVYVWSGYYQARQALVSAAGSTEIDLSTCAEQFTGSVLALCDSAHASEAVWVNFKLFGMMGLTISFVVAQAFYLARHIKDQPQAAEAD